MNLLDEISVFRIRCSPIVLFLPTIINALLVLIIGWVITKIVQWIVLRISDAVGIDTLASKSGVQKFLEKEVIKRNKRRCSFYLFLGNNFDRSGQFFNLLGMEVVSICSIN